MEYVPGETLDQLIRRRTPLSIANRLLILEDVCSGLQFAHTEGIVHRDIKPANVILDIAGTIKILDFGLAHAPDSGITRAGDQLGTLNYMSPEQVLGAHLDHRSDIYSVGALAYELISYQKAFPGTVRNGTMYRILNGDPAPLATLVPDLDPEVVRIVERAMRKEADQRYQSLDDMREDIASVRRRLEASDAVPALDADARPAVDARSGSPDGDSPLTPMPIRPSRARALAGVARDSTPLVREELASSAPTLGSASASGPRPPAAAVRRDSKRFVIAGAIVAALFVVLAAAYSQYASSNGRPTARATPGPPETLSPPAAAPTPNTVSSASDGDRSAAAIDERLKSIRATAAQQLAAGQRSQLLDTLNAGLYLDGNDVELNRLLDDLKRAARQLAAQARTNAARGGASEGASPEFRDGLARERGAEAFDRAGDRTQAIRTFWTATELFDRASATAARTVAPAVAAAPLPPPEPAPPAAKRDISSAPVDRPAPPAPPSASPPASDKPPQVALPATPVPSTPLSPDAGRDARASDVAAIQETLRRYAGAYGSRDVAAVRKVLPSLSVQQLRGLEKDFSDYRSYTVDIADPRITVDHETAVATSQVTRSYVSRSGVAGGRTMATTFRLRKIDGSWVIERVESR